MGHQKGDMNANSNNRNFSCSEAQRYSSLFRQEKVQSLGATSNKINSHIHNGQELPRSRRTTKTCHSLKIKAHRIPCQHNSGRLVYFVDNDSVLGNVIEGFLNLKGLRPKFFTDSETALQSLKDDQEKPVLMLTYLLMMRINGMELIERSKQVEPNLKTLLFTRNAGEETLQEFKEHYSVKPDGFLRDPLFLEILIAAVMSVLEEGE